MATERSLVLYGSTVLARLPADEFAEQAMVTEQARRSKADKQAAHDMQINGVPPHAPMGA